MISFMLATTLVVFIPSTLTEKQSLRCIATYRQTAEDGSCSKGDRMHLSASIAIGSGFGDLRKNFWLGNDKIYRITTANETSLQIELEDWSGKRVFAHYDVFKVDNEKNSYKITVIAYNGTYGDSLRYHNNIMFSTRDRDNDMWKTGSCSNDLTGGWWFNDCHNSNLNGQFIWNTKAYSGIGWVRFKHNLSLKFVEMKMRAQSFLKEKEDEREK